MRREREAVIVLGAGITGLTTAWLLSKRYGERVSLLEKESETGGLAGSVQRAGLTLDIGSHRIHQNYDPEAFALIQGLLGPDLLTRPRRGRVFIKNRFIKYPPSILEVCSSFGIKQTCSFIQDYLAARVASGFSLRRASTYEGTIVGTVGRSIYEGFYEPYALKMWGRPPSEISFEPAVNRVKRFEAKVLWRELANRIRGLRHEAAFSFHYPAGGIAQISEKIRALFLENGGKLLMASRIESVRVEGDRAIGAVRVSTAGEVRELRAERFVSTIPIEALHSLVTLEREKGATPPFDLRMRSLRIVYLRLPEPMLMESETLYIPDPRFRIGRVSDISRYSPRLAPADGTTILTVELLCDKGDALWRMEEPLLTELCLSELAALQVIRPGLKALGAFVRAVPDLYPVHDVGWRSRFDRIYGRLKGLENLYLAGRPALFLHCNIDHCIVMALRLSEVLLGDRPRSEWDERVERFFSFQVKD